MQAWFSALRGHVKSIQSQMLTAYHNVHGYLHFKINLTLSSPSEVALLQAQLTGMYNIFSRTEGLSSDPQSPPIAASSASGRVGSQKEHILKKEEKKKNR